MASSTLPTRPYVSSKQCYKHLNDLRFSPEKQTQTQGVVTPTIGKSVNISFGENVETDCLFLQLGFCNNPAVAS